MWSTGNFVKPLKANGTSAEGFTAAWAERTALYSTDIQVLPPKTWKKIVTAALKIVEKKRALLKPASVVPATEVSRHRQIIDADESD
jgi:hypothetical protein